MARREPIVDIRRQEPSDNNIREVFQAEVLAIEAYTAKGSHIDHEGFSKHLLTWPEEFVGSSEQFPYHRRV